MSASTPAPRPPRASGRPLRAGFLLTSLLTATALGGCSPATPSPDAYAEELAAALRSGDGARVGLPDGWEEDTLDGLAEVPRSVSLQEVSEPEERADGTLGAQATMAWSWQLGDTQTWDTIREVTLTYREDEERWSAEPGRDWVAEGLDPQAEVSVRRVAPARGDVLGPDGEAIVTSRPVYRVGLDKAVLAEELGRDATEEEVREAAAEVAEVAGVDAAGAADRAAAAGPLAFVEVLVVRQESPGIDLEALSEIPGGRTLEDTLPLAPTRAFAAPVLGRAGEATAEIVESSEGAISAGDVVGLSGLQRAVDPTLRGTPGVEVVATTGEEEQVLHTAPAADGQDVSITFDTELQQAAEEVLGQEERPAALVAVRPSDGHVLAAAVSPGAQGQNLAMTASVAPGSTFKVVSALALLRAGYTPDSPVTCTEKADADGFAVTNYPDYPTSWLGEISLTEAVAQSCNTAFVNTADDLDAERVAQAAQALGFGAPVEGVWEHGLGSYPMEASGTGLAASLFGQGEVLASPLAMATVAASVQAGATVRPVLVTGPEGVADTPPQLPAAPLTSDEADQLRVMMRAVVTDGGASLLADLPGEPAGAKTGTAEVGGAGDLRIDSWMIATQGDLAVAVWVQDGGYGSETAGPLVRDLLLAAQDS